MTMRDGDHLAELAATGPRLRAYLALERAIVDLDDARDPAGDQLRDCMDSIWFMLSEEDRAVLDRRIGDPTVFARTLALQEAQGEIQRRT